MCWREVAGRLLGGCKDAVWEIPGGGREVVGELLGGCKEVGGKMPGSWREV